MFQESLRSDPVMPTMRKTFAMIIGWENNVVFVIDWEMMIRRLQASGCGHCSGVLPGGEILGTLLRCSDCEGTQYIGRPKD